MPFLSLRDPVDVARAHAAYSTAWDKLVEENAIATKAPSARDRLAYIIAVLAPICADEDELVERAIQRFSMPDIGALRAVASSTRR